MRYRRLVLLLLGLCPILSARADSYDEVKKLLPLSLEELMEVKVTISTQSKQKLSKAPSVVTVITADDIRATGATNLMEVLQGVPGIYVRTNQFGFRPLVTLRGAAGTHTLLMVNGSPVRDLVWSSGIFWKGLTTGMIERVEIIRGPGSALFGSDASAGVINVITKTASRIEESEAGVRAGSFDTRTGWVQHGASWDDGDVALTAEMSRTDGYRPFIAADAQTPRDAATGTRVSFAPGRAESGWNSEDVRFALGRGNWRLLADYLRHSNLAIGLTGAGVLDPNTRGGDQRFNLALLYNNEVATRHWGINGEVRYQYLDYTSGSGFFERPPGYRESADPASAYPAGVINQMRSAERRLNVEASGLYTGLRDHALRVGGGYVWQDLYSVEQFVNQGRGPDGSPLPAGGPLVNLSDTPYAFAPEMSRRTSYLYLQDVWSFAEAWELTAGARYDRYSDFGGSVNPRLALVWQSTDRLTTKLMYGKAFRAPSYLELYALTSATRPNPNLTPERSRTWDLSFSYLASRDWRLGLNLYHFAQSNLIAADIANQFQNIGNHTIRGIEAEAQWQATRDLRVAASLSHRRQDNSPFIVFAAPDQEVYLRVDWAVMPQWNWNIQANRAGRRPLPPGDSRQALDADTVVDTTLRYLRDRHWEFAVSLRNLFDADVREYTGRSIPNFLPLPGRSLYAELRYRF